MPPAPMGVRISKGPSLVPGGMPADQFGLTHPAVGMPVPVHGAALAGTLREPIQRVLLGKIEVKPLQRGDRL
jgi:hypothetical protein